MTKKQTSKVLADPAVFRKSANLSQSAFWSPLGVGQSGGSRYESGREIPEPVALLLLLREQGVINDEVLAAAREMIRSRHADRVRV